MNLCYSWFSQLCECLLVKQIIYIDISPQHYQPETAKRVQMLKVVPLPAQTIASTKDACRLLAAAHTCSSPLNRVLRSLDTRQSQRINDVMEVFNLKTVLTGCGRKTKRHKTIETNRTTTNQSATKAFVMPTAAWDWTGYSSEGLQGGETKIQISIHKKKNTRNVWFKMKSRISFHNISQPRYTELYS